MYKILIVDDNKQIASILEVYAQKEGHTTFIALDGEEALELFRKCKPDILLLDVMLPKLDGFEVCKRIRQHSNVPIIMITARGEDFEKILGLDIGADDYIVKPFSAPEIMARVKAIMRRIGIEEESKSELVFHNLKINIDDYTISIGGEELQMTNKELNILWTLASNPNKVFSRENLLDTVWGYEYYGDSRTVDTHIKRLRAKIENYPKKNWEVKTIWGVGYKFEVLDE